MLSPLPYLSLTREPQDGSRDSVFRIGVQVYAGPLIVIVPESAEEMLRLEFEVGARLVLFGIIIDVSYVLPSIFADNDQISNRALVSGGFLFRF